MADNEYKLKVYSPAGLALEDTATQVSLPSSDGQIGVLPHHVGYTGLLGTGMLEYFSSEGGEPKRLVVSGGFCDFSADSLMLLADSVDLPDTLDRDGYAQNREEYTQTLETGNTVEAAWTHAKTQLDRIEAIDQLISH